MSAKSKSTTPATPNAKSSSASARVSRGVIKPSSDSISSLQNGRNSVDQSPRTSKGVIKPSSDSISSVQNGRTSLDRSPLPATPKPKANKSVLVSRKSTHVVKPNSDLQAELNQAHEDLKKAKEKLVLVEKEKSEALDEVRKTWLLCDEANKKLEEAENSEIEKFRALEMEQVSSEETKEDELKKELEAVKNQHALDMSALLSATEELQKVKQELAMTSAAKNQALNHADDATKIAEIHSEKVESLSAEVIRLRSHVEMQGVESNKLVSDLKLELNSLRQELEKMKPFEAGFESLNVDLEASKMVECYTFNLVRESEKLSSESIEAITKNLEESNDLLHDAKSKIAILKEKLGFFEISSEKHKIDLEESENRLEQAKFEASEMARKVLFLESELETSRKERLSNEKLAASHLQSLLEEKGQLVNELEASRSEEEKSKKALEVLASALHEVSTEARDAKEKLISSRGECDNYERQIVDSNKQINALTESVEQLRLDYGELKAELEEKELALLNSVKKSEEEKSQMEHQTNSLLNSLKLAEEASSVTRDERDCSNEENKRLKESLTEMKNEFRKIVAENEVLKRRAELSQGKIEELSKLLEEALDKKEEESGELTDCEKDYDMLPRVVEFSEQNGKQAEVNSSAESTSEVENSIDDLKGEKNEYSKQVDLKMWESCKIDAKDFSPERESEHESFDDELDSNGFSSSKNVGINGSSPSKWSSEKKKKYLLQKFGNLLKKKSSSNQK